jgi:HTH-type transcriptional regulator/antitoxin HigA
MSQKTVHPGVLLESMINERGVSQRDLASKIDVAYSLLNGIIKGNRNINVSIAMSLESAGFEDAIFWLISQSNFDIEQAKQDVSVVKKNQYIKDWDKIEANGVVPLSYLIKQNIGIETSEDVNELYNLYSVKKYDDLVTRVNSFNPTYFRKSSKFSESKNNIVAWSLVAKYKAKKQSCGKFKRSKEKELIANLKELFFYNESNLISRTKEILNSYGIKFLVLGRPPQTPVDGKSFMCGENPTIVLTLKYKRLDNFAFTLFHEIGHVFEHLTNPDKPEYRLEEFFINSSKTDIVEFEANNYASNNLINPLVWNEFIMTNEIDGFSDGVILEFSDKHKIHPGIVRGRVCFDFNEYYRKRSAITSLNKLVL